MPSDSFWYFPLPLSVCHSGDFVLIVNSIFPDKERAIAIEMQTAAVILKVDITELSRENNGLR
jgi:hypothetical protein